jgi:predicted GNAT family acetyltransferase
MRDSKTVTQDSISDAAKTEPTVVNSPRQDRYEISIAGELAGFSQYVDRDDERIFYHTEIDDRFAGRGLGSALISAALTVSRDLNKRVVAVCPFVAKYLERHHDFDDITNPVTSAALDAVRAVAGVSTGQAGPIRPH